MGKSKKNSSNFGEEFLSQDLTDDIAITPDAIESDSMTDTQMMTGTNSNANTATMRARTKMQQDQQSALQKKRGNQPDM